MRGGINESHKRYRVRMAYLIPKQDICDCNWIAERA